MISMNWGWVGGGGGYCVSLLRKQKQNVNIWEYLLCVTSSCSFH